MKLYKKVRVLGLQYRVVVIYQRGADESFQDNLASHGQVQSFVHRAVPPVVVNHFYITDKRP